jgi:hypothetical protein
MTRHALNEIRDLISQYLIARDRSLRIPSSTMALFSPSETRFDAVLTRQLEQLKSQAGRGITNSDQEIVKEVANVLAELGGVSWKVRSYFPDHGANPVTGFISAYLWGIIRDAAARRLDDVALEGADHLRDLCKGSIDRHLYLDARMEAERLDQLGNLSIINLNDVVLNAAVRGLSDCLLQNVLFGDYGNHITKDLLERLTKLSRLRLSSPLGLDMNKVSYSVGPFISVAEPSSLAQANIALVNAIAKTSRTDNWEVLTRLRSSYRELHDRLWLYLAELGIDAVKKNSFLLHYLNSSLEEIVKSHVWLLQATTDLPVIEVADWESAREQDFRESFRKKIRGFISWETTSVYSRIIPAMFEHKQLGYLDQTLELQCLFAFWCTDLGMVDGAKSASQRILGACTRLLEDETVADTYRSARQSILIAQIGTYALAKDEDEVVTLAVEQYRGLRNKFVHRYPDERFVGDFESAQRDLLENRTSMLSDSHSSKFVSTVKAEHIHAFFQLVNQPNG